MTEFDYIGDELTIFALAKNWKSYFTDMLTPFIRGSVAEPGAGIGTTTRALCSPKEEFRWLCIEPDRKMADALLRMRVEGDLPSRCQVHCGVLTDLPDKDTFDTVIYIDVIEHIEDDQREFEVAAARLNKGGRILILAPAWQHLYSPFDKQIGHFRRYSRATLTALGAPQMRLEASFYLDCVGYLASLANRTLLKQGAPTKSQILLWDNVMVRLSRILDPVLFHSAGRSVVAVWIRDNER